MRGSVAKLKGPGRLPLPKNLINKSPDELLNTLKRFGIEPDLGLIDLNAQRAYGTLARAINEGVEPDDEMWERIEEQHVKEMTQSLRQMTKRAISDYRMAQLAGNDKLMWLSVGDLDVCPSCDKRHGKVKTFKQWRASGLPGSGALICGSECRCHLIPA